PRLSSRGNDVPETTLPLAALNSRQTFVGSPVRAAYVLVAGAALVAGLVGRPAPQAAPQSALPEAAVAPPALQVVAPVAPPTLGIVAPLSPPAPMAVVVIDGLAPAAPIAAPVARSVQDGLS